jgi:hypothetical protein
MDRKHRPADSCAVAGRFRGANRRGASNVPSNNPKPSEPLRDQLEVLGSTVLHYLGPMPDFAEMGVHTAYHSLGLMAQLPGDRVGRNRCPTIERLRARRTVRVAKHLGPELTGLEAGTEGDVVQEAANILNGLLAICRRRWEQELPAACQQPPVQIWPDNLPQLGPEADHSLGACRLEAAPCVGVARAAQRRLWTDYPLNDRLDRIEGRT